MNDATFYFKGRAEDILRKYEEEEFDVDGEEAAKHQIRIGADATKTATKPDEDGFFITSLEIEFSNAIDDWRIRQWQSGSESEIFRAARRLVHIYEVLRIKGCLLDGRATKRRFAQKEAEVDGVRSQLSEATKKLGVTEDHLRQCCDEKVELENKNKEQKEQLDAIRATDIKRSMGSSQSELENDR